MMMKQRIRLIYLIVFLIFSSIGCGLSLYTYDDNLFFFTFLSNVFCWVLMVIELLKTIRRSPSSDAWVRLHFVASFCIMLTGLIYNVLLGRPSTSAYWHNYQSLILHVFVPITFIVYFLVTQEPSAFSGVMKCPECGGNLNFHFNQNNHDIKFFSCQNHNSGLRKCSSTHYIRLDFLEQVVLYEVHRLACFANEYENDFIKAMVGRSAKVAENERVRKKRE